MPQDEPFELIVTGGIDMGARLVVTGERPVSVGRSPDADLVLHDPRVSRKHLEICHERGAARVRTQPSALPIEVGGGPEIDVLVARGAELVVGGTTIRIADADAAASPDLESTATLLSTRITEVEGFAAVFALSESLERASDMAAFEAKVAVWARRYIPARDVQFRIAESDDGRRPRALEVTVKPVDGGRIAITVPATVPDRQPVLIELTVAASPADVTGQFRRLLLIAARLCALALGRLDAVSRVEQNALDLREIAVGSARAFLGTSPAATRVAALVPKLAASDAAVLLEGETGTGKSFVARLLHESSPRAREPFRVINCGAIPEALVEAELFGHERGAFTGAVTPRAGAFESAGRGTLFLDEIGELPLASQAKLLRALEERRFERVGSNKTLPLEARVLAATNRDLLTMAGEGRFRADLYYRLSVVKLTIPPLRERGDDLVLLARHLLSDLARQLGKRPPRFTPEALAILQRHTWPGNVRELRNALEHALVLGSGPDVDACDLPFAVPPRTPEPTATASGAPDTVHLPATLAALEARAIDAAMRAAGGHVGRAAGILGVARATLYNKLNQQGALLK